LPLAATEQRFAPKNTRRTKLVKSLHGSGSTATLARFDVFSDVASIGYVGVGLFFVLSGFILVYTYEGRALTTAEFWRARFARIYPAYAVSLLVTLPLFLAAVRHTHLVSVPWPVAHLKLGMFLQVVLLQAWVPAAATMWNAVSWSLSVEASFTSCFLFF
jgi:peptidoglycan/LPS O-acetylase OafA/YrhL